MIAALMKRATANALSAIDSGLKRFEKYDVIPAAVCDMGSSVLFSTVLE